MTQVTLHTPTGPYAFVRGQEDPLISIYPSEAGVDAIRANGGDAEMGQATTGRFSFFDRVFQRPGTIFSNGPITVVGG